MGPCEVAYKEGYNFSIDNYTKLLKLIPPMPTVFTFLLASESMIKNHVYSVFFNN